MSAPLIETTDEERKEVLNDFLADIRRQKEQIRAALPAAHSGITTLVAACACKTGQSYHLRALLYSLWNGKPARLLEIVSLDRPLRAALLAVMNVFGADAFFYDEISRAFKVAGLYGWFLEEGEEGGAK